MAASVPVTIVNVGYRSTNFWVVSAGTSRLLVDLGWPGMIGPLLTNLERKGIPLKEITHGLATHYHIDHAGAAQDLKQRAVNRSTFPPLIFVPASVTRTRPALESRMEQQWLQAA